MLMDKESQVSSSQDNPDNEAALLSSKALVQVTTQL